MIYYWTPKTKYFFEKSKILNFYYVYFQSQNWKLSIGLYYVNAIWNTDERGGGVKVNWNETKRENIGAITRLKYF